MGHLLTPASFLRVLRRSLLPGLALGVLSWSMATSLWADDAIPSGKDRDEVLKVRRFELMESRVAALKIESAAAGFPSQFAAKPIFKYSDPARGYVAASVWKLGDQGRPKALLAVELDRNTYGKPCISYERSSLTETPFTTTVEGMVWSPKGTQYRFRPLPGAGSREDAATAADPDAVAGQTLCVERSRPEGEVRTAAAPAAGRSLYAFRRRAGRRGDFLFYVRHESRSGAAA